ncbi:hypothetical protein DL764_002564 [Monosporascus ibericus]|uniref:Protein kinase domain-containing protein n=1 Tax=Monosporascus ibericus TaxID=155417 RepID=A0A4Q4TL43_9PEZI|nr:hypothetical protein DL764_002564 [Monosporascus ibericus]
MAGRTFLAVAVVALATAVAAQEQNTCDVVAEQTAIEVLKPLTLEYNAEQQEYWSTTNSLLKPTCILTPSTADEVAAIVAALRSTNETFAVKSGGHNPNNYWASVDGGPLISTKKLNEVLFDAETGTVRVGPGNRWDEVAEALDGTGYTAVGGRIGGLSFLSAQYGWAANSVLEFTLVLPNASVVAVREDNYPDIFMVLKGGGNNYGIVTSFLLQAYRQGDIWGGTFWFDANDETTPAILQAVRDFTEYNTDHKAALIPTAERTLATLVDLWIVFAFYDGPEPPAGTFDNFTSIGPFINTAKTQSMSELVSGNNWAVLEGSAYQIGTETIPLPSAADGPEFMGALYDHWVATSNKVQGEPGLIASMALQPAPRRLAAVARAKGGDLIDLDEDADRLVIELNYSFLYPDDFTYGRVERTMRDTYGGVRDLARNYTDTHAEELGNLYLPLFANDAFHAQDYFARLRPEKAALARRVAAELDPEGLFRTRTDKVDVDASIWTLYNGTRREDGSNCSIFAFDAVANKSRLPLAKNALKKLRTMRHPGVIKVLDTVETDSYIYIATERVVPLRWNVRRKSLTPETIKWGLCAVARTVKFINEEGSSIHGSLRVASIYTSESGEWKLGGFEIMSNVKDDEAVIYTYGSLVPDSGRYTPPELAKSGWDAIKRSPHTAVDSYNLGTLVFEVFNGDFLGADQAGQTKGVPPSMHASYKRLVNANPKARITVGAFLEQGRRSGGFFDSTLIKLTEGIDNLGVKSEEEKERFLDDLDQLSDDFPEDFFKMKVLPELLKAVEFGGGGPKAFSVVMKISTKLSDDDFTTRVQPVVVRLFANPDRAIRVCLLDNLPLMIDRLPQKVVNDKIFPQIVSGFTDVAPVVREQTLKSVLTIINKLSDRTINGELLKYLAKTANDEQPGIRTNTTICLGKIAKNLGASSRSKVLIAAFTRSLRDPFVHARNAALLALAATAEYFSDEDCASRILPVICPSLLDKEKLVRDQANKAMDVYLQKIRAVASSMPDSVLPPPSSQMADGAAAAPRMSTPQPSSQSAAASWAGWAISSFTNQLSTAAGQMQTTAGSNGTARAASPSMATGGGKATPGSSSASTLHRQVVKPTQPPASMSRTSSTAVAEAFFKEGPNPSAAGDEDGEEEFADAWGDMGDMNDENDNNDDDFSFGGSSTSPPSTARKEPAKKTTTTMTFDDGSEPDFAGWLAAQAQKKNPGGAGGKPLPKGLAKSGSGSGSGAAGSRKAAPMTTAVSRKPVVAKKIDMKPKDTGDDDGDGWGDGW